MHVRPRERKSQPQGTVLGGLPPQAEVKGPGRLRRPHMGFDFFPIHNQQQCTLLIRAGKPADPGWEGPPGVRHSLLQAPASPELGFPVFSLGV